MVQPGDVRLQHDADKDKAVGAKHHSFSPDPLPLDSLDLNVEGRDLAPPQEGFGQLWRKRFRIRLTGANVPSTEVVRVWREHFGEFWPESNRFYRPLGGLKPGEVALADLEMAPGGRLSTGVVVVDASPTSFTFMTPRGHSFAGQITFSAHDEAGTTIAQVEILMRASDPLFEISLLLGGHKRENEFWQTTLLELADHFGVEDQEPEVTITCPDPNRQWSKATNIVYNSLLHTAFYMATRPLRRLLERLKRRGETS
ncbi:MAG TPA: hypothetical protein VGR22_00450 [Thermomicrobiales bacterium]|nr:hypothetical protein [Thermomicrobiales bacterium]